MSLLSKLFGNKNKSAPHQIIQAEADSHCLNKQQLIERYGGIALEKQGNFDELVQNFSWEADLDKGRISFAGKMSFPLQVLGTLSYSSTTWLWAWANSRSEIPPALLQQALILKQYGEDGSIDLLSNGEYAADDRDLHIIGLIASGMFNASGYYLADYERGMMCVTVKSDDIDSTWQDSHHAILTTFPQLISLYEINHKNALSSYLKLKGYQVVDNGNQLIGSRNEAVINAEFDEQFRLTSLKG
ncbi:DUF6882 domain-containing protein [Pragia fontium]|uniref:DUF6882 domain-containing protein n=1 Tax=Pragia fontium TaxID=82985 RepID=UPI00069A03CD|nr:DUF6882 domain-containing protein [Pragia fontium]